MNIQPALPPYSCDRCSIPHKSCHFPSYLEGVDSKGELRGSRGRCRDTGVEEHEVVSGFNAAAARAVDDRVSVLRHDLHGVWSVSGGRADAPRHQKNCGTRAAQQKGVRAQSILTELEHEETSRTWVRGEGAAKREVPMRRDSKLSGLRGHEDSPMVIYIAVVIVRGDGANGHIGCPRAAHVRDVGARETA